MPIIEDARNALKREVDLLIAFTWRNYSFVTIPGFIVSFGAALNIPEAQERTLFSTLSNHLLLLLWLTLCIYFSDLSNQIVGIEEDRINKPDRPIPSGKVSLEGARVRWAISLAAFLGLGLVRPLLLPEILLCVLISGFLCYTKAGNHWIGKNSIAMPIACWAILSGSWKTIALTYPEGSVRSQMKAISIWLGLLMQIQDLRDVEGDRIIGRKTLPIAFGYERSRQIIVFLLSPPAILVLCMGDVLQIAPTTLLGLHSILLWRVLRGTDARYDHKTYMVSLCSQ
ncbi:hypothetical protein CVT26_013332 [Gymnopilus dilepis]|uniref:UbiA prenyltransferase n=1 Tax=Gymnopilus dilepis TaxID=231916 RepID=A0A409YEZ9_9AGAR|nr:hypothetical protein CVT26_013332 [Gymnopilus dilepis]